MPAQISRWGHSLGVRIPSPSPARRAWAKGTPSKCPPTKASSSVRPARTRYTLDELIERLTPRNRHRETDWGYTVGNELW
jgi:antitoxin MazE